MLAPVLIFAVGNESRGDDALGPLLLRALNDEIMNSGRPNYFELLEEFQLQVEHAMDMQGRQLVLFIDAGMDTPDPLAFYRLQQNETAALFSHALMPDALLTVYTQLYQVSLPDVFAMCIRGERFELGEDLTPQAIKNLALAVEFCKSLLHEPEVAAWDSHCTQKTIEVMMNYGGHPA